MAINHSITSIYWLSVPLNCVSSIEAVVDPFVAALLNRLPELVRHDPSLISSSEVAVGSTIKRPSSGIGTPRKSPKLESRPVISEAKVPEPAQSLPRAVLPGSRPVLPAAMLPSVTDTVPVSVTPKLPEPEILAPAPAVSLSVSAAPSSSASSSEFFTCIPSSVFGELDAEIAKHKQLTNVTKSPILALSLSPSTGSTDLVSNSDLSYTQSNPFAATISGSRILTGSKALQPVHEVTFASLPWTYEAGAALSVLAPNPPELVDRMLSLLQFDDVTASFAVSGCEKAGITHAFTRNDGGVLVSPKLALQWIPDLSQFPAKPVLRFLADRATDKSEKRRLLFLCSKEGIASYRALRESGATTADLLELFPSAIPKGSDAVTFLGVLCEHAARLQARCYSYSSAPSSSNVSVAFNTQEWTTPHGIKRRGIATSHLLSRVGGQVLVFPRIETGGFVAPESAYEGNVLMIATGTGITPFRAFLEARAKQTADQRKGKWWLVYGCRFAGEEGDSVYLDEIRTWKEQGVLDRLDVVYSRDTGRSELSAEFGAEQKAGAKYVQHALALHASELYSFLADDNSIVYTCGEYKTMGRGVVTALAEIWEERQGWEKGKGIEYWMEERGEKGGYRRDVWG